MDILEAFYDFCKEPDSTLKDVVREYSGMEIKVPSYKRAYRNDEIIERYKEGAMVKELAQEFQLCDRTIWDITYELRNHTL